MLFDAKRSGALVLRLIVGLALLGWPRVGSAQGNWSVIATAGTALGQVSYPTALAVDPAGNCYVAESRYYDAFGTLVGVNRIQKRDAQGNWSVIATEGFALGQVFNLYALAVDTAGNLYVAEEPFWDSTSHREVGIDRIQKRDVQGNWSVIATVGSALGQVRDPSGLAVDGAGNLYVADYGDFDSAHYVRIQKRDAQANWSVIAFSPPYPVPWVALAADAAGNLYATDATIEPAGAATLSWIEKRDAQGNWSVIAFSPPYPVPWVALAADAAGNLYAAYGVVDNEFFPDISSIEKRDAQGNWSVIATYGAALGQVNQPSGLAADGAGNLYVADTGNNRVLKFSPAP